MLGRFSRDDEWDKPRFLADWTGGFLLAPAALFDSPGRQPRTTARIGASSFFGIFFLVSHTSITLMVKTFPV